MRTRRLPSHDPLGKARGPEPGPGYQQEVNAEMVGQSDKVIHELASLTSELARSEFKLFSDGRGGAQSSNEVPGLLVTVVFLSLGAAFWYSTLESLASLRPQLAIKAGLRVQTREVRLGSSAVASPGTCQRPRLPKGLDQVDLPLQSPRHVFL